MKGCDIKIFWCHPPFTLRSPSAKLVSLAAAFNHCSFFLLHIFFFCLPPSPRWGHLLRTPVLFVFKPLPSVWSLHPTTGNRNHREITGDKTWAASPPSNVTDNNTCAPPAPGALRRHSDWLPVCFGTVMNYLNSICILLQLFPGVN